MGCMSKQKEGCGHVDVWLIGILILPSSKQRMGNIMPYKTYTWPHTGRGLTVVTHSEGRRCRCMSIPVRQNKNKDFKKNMKPAGCVGIGAIVVGCSFEYIICLNMSIWLSACHTQTGVKYDVCAPTTTARGQLTNKTLLFRT